MASETTNPTATEDEALVEPKPGYRVAPLREALQRIWGMASALSTADGHDVTQEDLQEIERLASDALAGK